MEYNVNRIAANTKSDNNFQVSADITLPINTSDINNAPSSILRRDSRTGLQKYVKTTSIENNVIVVDSANIIRNDIPSDEKLTNNNTLQTLTSLAKTGKISSTNSLFDVEVVNNLFT